MDLTGIRFGRLVVLQEAERHVFPRSKKTERRLLCRCDCGKEHTTLLMHLRNGRTSSCGCLRGETNTIHGLSEGNATYYAWMNMVRRGTGKVMQKNYADRGIDVCPEWLTFSNFLRDMGERPSDDLTLERIDNSEGYFPGNCKWATRKEQSRNKRGVRMITYKGVTKCASDWAESIGVERSAFLGRLNRGWTVERALTTPTLQSYRRVEHRRTSNNSANS